CSLWRASTSRTLCAVVPMHEICGVPFRPSVRISRTVSSVPSRVEPPAPNVTEQNAGFKSASVRRAARSFSAPSTVRGGKNSTLQLRLRSLIAGSGPLRNQGREQPRDHAVHDRAEYAGPEAGDMETGYERSDRPEQKPVDHEDEQAERQDR